MSTKKPTSFRFDQGTLDLIDRLGTENHLDNRAETIKKAVAVLNVLTSATQDKKSIFLKDEKGEEQQIILV